MTDFLSELPSQEDIRRRINGRFESMLRTDREGKKLPYVCSVCDEYIIRVQDVFGLTTKLLKKPSIRELLSWDQVPEDQPVRQLESYYKFEDETYEIGDRGFLKGLCLSPRGSLYKKSVHGNAKPALTCCESCHGSLTQAGRLPYYAVINKNYVGGTPECLLELTEVELALLTPVQSYGYCITMEGGRQKSLAGTLSFFRIKEARIAGALTQLETLGLTKHVLVMFKGNMTPKQKQRATEKATIRTEKVLQALHWLNKNHVDWMKVDLETIVEELRGRRVDVVDGSREVESQNANVEQEELFTCFYPESNITPTQGGFDEPGLFQKFVEDMAQKGFDMEFQLNLRKEFAKGNNSDILKSTSLLQFPYGVGSINEIRRQKNGAQKSTVDMEGFLAHLSKKADRHFQHEMFQLIMYSLMSKDRILRSSRLQLRSAQDAANMAKGLDAEDVRRTVEARKHGNWHGGTHVSRKLVGAVDACSKYLPHTREASKKARSTGESIQHYFGTGSIFLTVTFDDEDGWVMQVLTGIEVDKESDDYGNMSEKDLREKHLERQSVRIKFPGSGAIHFEMMLDILLKEVVGWDVDKGCATDRQGMFGECIALSLAVEEQGRKTLHVHMTIWIKAFNRMRHDLFFGNARERKEATMLFQAYYDRLASTKFFPTATNDVKEAFDHKCTQPFKSSRSEPEVVNLQELRNLRHKYGYKENGGSFAYCREPNCNKTWTYEELVQSFVVNTGGFCQPTETELSRRALNPRWAIPKNRLRAELVKYQQRNLLREPTSWSDTMAVNALRQTHASNHTKGCFTCTGKPNHKCGPSCECRYRLPDMGRKRTTMKVNHEGIQWFKWDGTSIEQPILQILPKRGKYDLFQNVSCAAISESKFACNSNVSVILDGPIAQYMFKYHLKSNQKDETADYAAVQRDIKKLSGRVHECDKRESIRLITRAAFAHTKTQVLSGSLASYLLRHDTRFYFSHKFAFCPLMDIMRIYSQQRVSGTLRFTPEGKTYFENHALHYLCRSKELEDCSLKDFVEVYETKSIRRGKNHDDEILPFQADTGHYKHPSAKKSKKRNSAASAEAVATQGSKPRETPLYAKVSQWAFVDTADLNCQSIVTCHVDDINVGMEKYAELLLTLLTPHRCGNDLRAEGTCHPFTMQLRKLYKIDELLRNAGGHARVFTDDNLEFLQNIQNSAYNSLRYKLASDELADETVPFQNEAMLLEGHTEDDGVADEEVDHGALLEMLYDSLDLATQPIENDDNPAFLNAALHHMSFSVIRQRGLWDSGTKKDMRPLILGENVVADDDLVTSHDLMLETAGGHNRFTPDPKKGDKRKTYPVGDIVRILLRRTTLKEVNLWEGKDVHVEDANGSLASIREWGTAALGTDRKQQRAFEAIIASFILTFYTETEDEPDDTTTMQDRPIYRQSKETLRKLMGSVTTDQLICLLHGPGGSGKSTVLNLIKAYARSYCDNMKHPFGKKTIVVTAMSGVAATLIGGETTHKILGLNRKGISEEEKDSFTETRLIFIDEISFASIPNLEKIQHHLQLLMRDIFTPYGGVNVVFAGDYSQLEPVNSDPVYTLEEDGLPEFHGMLNCFIELNGKWRFRQDGPWGEMMYRFRAGNPTLEDVRKINQHTQVCLKPPPVQIQVASYRNRDRDAINCAIFESYCEANNPPDGSLFDYACVILMTDIQVRNDKKTYVPMKLNSTIRHFYENCGEDAVSGKKGNSKKNDSSQNGRMDPVLKLYPGCPLMFTQNSDVSNGEANGSRVAFKSAKAKPGETYFVLTLQNGTKIRAFYATQIEYILVKHENPNITPAFFKIDTTSRLFECTFRIDDITNYDLKLKATQFPVVSNSCTTGHKLQGCTSESLLVNDWYYGQNWVYVVLSRVRTMAGLYIRQKLSEDLRKYSKDPRMIQMLANFHDTIGLPNLTEAQYTQMQSHHHQSTT